MRRRSSRFALLALLSAILAACGQSPAAVNSPSTIVGVEPTAVDEEAGDDLSMPPSPTPTVPPSTTAVPREYAVGEIVRLEPFLVQVNAVTTTAEIAFAAPPKPDHQYLLVDVTLTNSGPQPEAVVALPQMLVQDANGEYIEIDPTTSMGLIAFNGSVINPGSAARGTLSYQIREGASKLQWVFRNLKHRPDWSYRYDADGKPTEASRAVFAALP